MVVYLPTDDDLNSTIVSAFELTMSFTNSNKAILANVSELHYELWPYFCTAVSHPLASWDVPNMCWIQMIECVRSRCLLQVSRWLSVLCVTDMVQEMTANWVMIGCLASHVAAAITVHVLKLLVLLTMMTLFVCQLYLNVECIWMYSICRKICIQTLIWDIWG